MAHTGTREEARGPRALHLPRHLIAARRPDTERYWDEVVSTKRQTRTEVEDVALEQVFAENTKTRITFSVTYRTAVNTTETDGWTDPPRALSQWVTVVRAGGCGRRRRKATPASIFALYTVAVVGNRVRGHGSPSR